MNTTEGMYFIVQYIKSVACVSLQPVYNGISAHHSLHT